MIDLQDLQQERCGKRVWRALDQQAVEPPPGLSRAVGYSPCPYITNRAELLEQLLNQRLSIGGSQPLVIVRRGVPGRIELDQRAGVLKANKWSHQTVLATDLRMAPLRALGCCLPLLVDPWVATGFGTRS